MKALISTLALAALLGAGAILQHDAARAAQPPLSGDRAANPSPIEKELNRALQKSIDRATRRPGPMTFGKIEQTRISVTHELVAPFPADQKNNDEARERILMDLRRSLYSQVADECNLLSEIFNKRCHFSGLSVRPKYAARPDPNEVRLSATATYILSGRLGR